MTGAAESASRTAGKNVESGGRIGHRLMLAASLTVFLSPAFADYLKSFFMTHRQDQGLKQAAEQGLSKPLGIAIADRGITLLIKEVLADTERIAVVCDILDREGRSFAVGRTRRLLVVFVVVHYVVYQILRRVSGRIVGIFHCVLNVFAGGLKPLCYIVTVSVKALFSFYFVPRHRYTS